METLQNRRNSCKREFAWGKECTKVSLGSYSRERLPHGGAMWWCIFSIDDLWHWRYRQSWRGSSFHSHNTAADYTGTGATLSPASSPQPLCQGWELNDNLTAPGATEARFSSTTTTPEDGLTPGEKVGSAGLRRCSGHCGMCSQEAN